MRKLGIIILILGVIILFLSIGMFISASSPLSILVLIFSFLLNVVGVGILIFSRKY